MGRPLTIAVGRASSNNHKGWLEFGYTKLPKVTLPTYGRLYNRR
jgi:hypothetical protein